MNYTTNKQEKGVELINNLIQQSWKDDSFKKELIDNPTSVIERITGKHLVNIGEKKIVVEDQTDTSKIYLNIPVNINSDELQLTEEQLEMISGGVTPTYVVGFVVAVGACALVDYLRD